MNSHFSFNRLLILFALALVSISPQAFAQKSKKTASAQTSSRSVIVVRTEPKAIVWLDEIRRGVTDDEGKLTLSKVSAGRHTLRVRARGFKESSVAIAPARRGTIDVKLVRTTDEAELLFQQAEEARESARDDEARKQAAELYRRTIAMRPRFAAAHLGLARVLLDLNDYNTALEEIGRARNARPVYPEASAVEGRILRMAADTNAAIDSFRRAIREARGFQPEAHTGLAIVLEEKGRYEEAVEEFRAAINQLSDTEPVLYQLLGAAYEKLQKYKEAVRAYEKYLELAPEGTLAPALRSILDQLRTQAAEQEGAANP
ncbi:MAG TPA: tetratricopeptide repeat protein [Pyrinomonadaceae bacterium]|nr:tetratricopeptide repeat protein [Pyrinomonadaceae bacterium]